MRIGGQPVYLSCKEWPDGRLAGIKIDASRTGTMTRALLDTVGTFLSIGLQYGIPLAEYLEWIKGLQFEPSGPVSGSVDVIEAKSVLDFVAQQLEICYLGKSYAESASLITHQPDRGQVA